MTRKIHRYPVSQSLNVRSQSVQRKRKTRLELETLETRALPVVGAWSLPAAVEPGGDYDGVVKLSVLYNGNEYFSGSGSLLASGRHILTAAHVVDLYGDDGIPEYDFRVEYQLPGGHGIKMDVPKEDIIVHPGWNGNLAAGNDLAILELSALAPSGSHGADRYQIYRDNDEWGQIFTAAGYGNTGTGSAGWLSGTSETKRIGQNRWDIDLSYFYGFNPDNQLSFDFDRGWTWLDTGRYYGEANTGLGAAESNIAPGDSGGPAFLGGNKIAGINSWGMSLFTDLDRTTNSSFGEISTMTRVSVFADWIDNITAGPQPLVLDMNSQVSGNDGSADSITITWNGPNLELHVNGEIYHSENASTISSLTIIGSGDNDTVTVLSNPGRPVEVIGGGGNDTLRGGNGANLWNLTGPNSGNINGTTTFSDIENLQGGTTGDRYIFFADGSISGNITDGSRWNTLDYSNRTTGIYVDLSIGYATSVAGTVSGIERVWGGEGSDFIVGDSQANTLLGNGGHDILLGGAGADTLDGGNGDDMLFGELNSDRLIGGPGDDVLAGDSGDDYLIGGSGHDTLLGGSGYDVLDGGDGYDYLAGGSQNDRYVFHTVTSGMVELDTVVELAGGGLDRLDFSGLASDDGVLVDLSTQNYLANHNNRYIRTAQVNQSAYFENVTGGAGDDILLGNDAANSLWGGAGDDILYGAGGNDTLYGGSGIDVLDGGSGWDRGVDGERLFGVEW